MKNALKFWSVAAVTFCLCHFIAVKTLPPLWYGATTPDTHFDHEYLSTYQDIGLDFYVVRHGLFGVDKIIDESDVICYSSSKGLFGFDPDIIAQHLSTPERPVKVMNLSFGFGEGFGFLAEIIKSRNIHDKVLIADITDNTCYYHLTPMAQLSLQAETPFDAYKVVFEKWMAFARDRALLNHVPRIRLTPERGLLVEHTLAQGLLHRSWQTGRVSNFITVTPPQAPIRGKIEYPFDPTGELKPKFLDLCAERNIKIIFTSIPYQGYDDEWGRKIAESLGCRHVAVEPDGIELYDPWHMSVKGRPVFSHRLGEKLREAGLLQTEFVAARSEERRYH